MARAQGGGFCREELDRASLERGRDINPQPYRVGFEQGARSESGGLQDCSSCRPRQPRPPTELLEVVPKLGSYGLGAGGSLLTRAMHPC